MPSTPRKVHGNKEGMSRGTAIVTDSDSDDDLPSLIPCTGDEDSDDEEDNPKKPASKAKGKGKSTTNAKNNAECADMWYKLNKDEKEKHIHVMKVYLLSPFLFGHVFQEDKWINWAYECGLLISKSSFEIRALEDKHFDAVDLIETAFNKLADHALLKNKDGLVKTFDIIGSSGVTISQHLDKAVTCAENFLAFTNLRDKIKLKSGVTKKQGDVALLLAHNQVSDHIKQWAAGVNLVEIFNKRCKEEEDQTADKRKEGNDAFSKGKYTAAISVYTRALHVSPYNHVLYGNRAQSYLKTKDLWCALTDGRRAVVLKPEWHKAQYRYAQAFFELGNVIRAKETNRAARKSCSEKKDLETQFDKFEKGILTTKEVKGKANGNKKTTKQSNILLDDLPALVDANSSDTSRNSDDDYGVPELVELEDEDTADSTHDESEDLNSGSSDGYESDDSSSRKKSTSTPAPKKRRPNRKVRKVLRETAQDKAKQEEKAKREEKEKKMAEIAARKENKKVEKRNKKTKVTQVDQNGNPQQKREFIAFLKQGSKAIIEKKCVMAVRSYREAITILEQNDFQYQVFDLKEIDFVILLYGFGAACLELGSHEDLRAAKKQFEIIVLQHKNVVFPLAYLGTGRVCYKQNRYTEALEPLEEGLALVNQLGDDLASYRWPGSQIIIEETKPGKLLSAIETLIRICRHPPRPDAICRYPDCSNKAQIYLTDSDYKGHIRLVCHEECKVEFHPVCWKKQKGTQEGKAGDKDFLEDGCMTPDCGGSVVNIQIYDNEGLKTEFKSEKLGTKPETKHKATKQNRVKASGVAAKQKKKKEKEDLKIEDATPTDTDTAEEEPAKPAPPPPPPLPPFIAVQKEEKPFKEEHVENGGHETINADANIQEGGGVFILRKDEDEDPTKGVGKAKSRKKKSKNTQTLDEFLKDRGGQQTFRPGFGETTGDMDDIIIPKGKFDLVPPPPGWSQHEMEAPFAVPPHLQGDTAQIEASYRDGLNMFSFSPVTAPRPQIDLQAVTDYVSSMLQEILRANGPLELADPNIMQPLSMLPDNYQDIISNAGGLRPILEQSGKFLFQGNRVMLPEDKDFEDLVQTTLKPHTNNPFLERIGASNNGAKLDNWIHSEDTLWNIDTLEEKNTDNEAGDDSYLSSSTSLLFNSGSSSSFNPEAKEFVPSLSQTDLLDNSSSKSSLVSDSSTLKDVELVDDQIVENENTIAEEPEPVSNSAKVQEPDSNDAGECQPVSNGADEHKPVSNGADENKPVSNGADEHKPVSNGADEHKPVSNGADGHKPVSNEAEEHKPVFNGTEEGKPVSNGTEVENFAKSNTDMKTNNGTQDEGVVDAARVSDFAKKAESVAVNGKSFEDSTCNLSQATNTVEPVMKDTVFVSPAVTEITTQAVKCSHKRTGSSNSSASDQPVVISKAKSVQTQPNVKHKGVGTDPIPEPYKAEYQRAVAEKDSLQARLLENTDRHNALLNKNSAEVDKVKKKLSDALQEKEKYSKELQEIKQKNLEEIRKLRQQSEDKDSKIKLLNQKMLQSADDKSSVMNSLKKELTTFKGQFALEKDSWNKDRSEKEDLLKNTKLQHQQQQTRAQEAEIKLLELRRDVGLRFLERAYQESHITINNLIQAVNARIAGPKVEELITTWKNYAAECHQRVVQCKATFNEQIELLKTGRTLGSVPQLTIPGPPPYPAIPVLQSVVPGQPQQQHNQPQPLAESNTPAPRAADPPLPSALAGAAAVGPSAVVPTSGAAPAVNEDKPVTAAAPAPAPVAADKARPSNSFEKIMLRLSTMYPNFTRLELTVFIKEVRHNKHGSLTGLSLEDIVTSVSELVEQKKKTGLLRVGPVPPTSSPTMQRTAKPATVPQKNQTAQSIAQEVSKMMIVSGSYEEDPCVICHEDMNASYDIVTLECGHRYHSPCIRKWLLGEQSTCPTCRVHALLPDEFPRLK